MTKINRFGRKVVRWIARRLGVRFVATLPSASDRALNASEAEKQFYLDSDMTSEQDWSEVVVGNDRRLALRMTCFDSLHSHPVMVGKDTLLSLEICSRGGIADESLSLAVFFHPEKGEAHELMRAGTTLLTGKGEAVFYSISLGGLAGNRGAFEIKLTHPGEALNYIEVMILEFAVADAGLLPLLRARSHESWRLENELSHFSNGVYDHAMYAGRKAATADKPQNGHVQTDKCSPAPSNKAYTSRTLPRDAAEMALKEAEWAWVKQGDDPYHYAHRLLGKLLPIQPPDFSARLRARDGKSPVRLLSLCSGTAAVELGIIAASGVNVEATFVDINRGLIEQTIGQLPGNCCGQFIIGNVNDVWPMSSSYDIVVCVSGLHHIVELERVLEGIKDCLEPDGEFWVIGEQIGRNGNRLWPEAVEACNQVMSEIAPRYRINAYSGSVDERLPNNNFGSASFEGIRSEEIEGVIDRYFFPVSEYRRNAFLWRLVNQTYSNNYDMQKEVDVQTLQRLAIAEADCWWHGGRPTELFGVYAPRRLTIEWIQKGTPPA